jgi:hypothetical protein
MERSLPWSISFDETVDCCFVRWTGTLNLQGLWGFMRAVVGEPWYRPGLNVLHDFRDAAAAPLDTEVRQLGSAFQAVKPAFGDSGRVALLVPNPKDLHLAQTYTSFTRGSGRVSEAFTDWNEARAWLGLGDDYVPPGDRPSI